MKTCKKCGAPKPLTSYTVDTRYKDGYYPWCAECRRAWRQARKDKQRELHRNWSAQNREHVREESRKAYHGPFKERKTIKRRAYDRQRWHTDPAYRAKKNQWKAHQRKHNPVFREKARLWGRLARQRRRARERALENTLTKNEWYEILREQGNRCAACHRKFGARLKPTMDHIAPMSQRHALTKDNCQALCKVCNSRKHTKTIDYRPLKQVSFLDEDG